MDAELIWECDMMSRDNMTHPLVRHIAAQTKYACYVVATICRTRGAVEANPQVTQMPKFGAPRILGLPM